MEALAFVGDRIEIAFFIVCKTVKSNSNRDPLSKY